MRFQRLALIGCGLMGGSFALALREAGLVQTIVGFSASEKTRQRAVELQVIDQACASVAEAVQGADLVLLAVPVGAMHSSFAAMRDALQATALLMDVGSTKCDVIAAAQATLGERLSCFVPAHPIAGKEVAGIEHAEAALYKERRTILTPLPQTSIHKMQAAHEVWTAIGSHVSTMTPEAHDATFAAVSHLPHLLAFAAVNALTAQPQGPAFLDMAGPGFRDFSRIAASDASVWRDILSANHAEVLTQIAHFRAALEQFENTLKQGNTAALQQLIQQASDVRSAWTLQAGNACNTASED
ncbi:prephenate dehydrogenase [Limnohabitans radicicola]|uniref:Prephenate dehydrogenase/arogenate dehydrogenase family protein n=1 Tax=Limnohabitans radicicola TaxID=2771427 RepID=A0A927FHR9_9BURK|nr:prephenate dehydrogenase/arogenate dehydrogenase family protein [Limnohabitans radicicola]MBD8051714.1 prephenate dehydrogenase/arogenate dehydrogenase family protein [Limnohabitans radicicola]